jgi:hypothetical protein
MPAVNEGCICSFTSITEMAFHSHDISTFLTVLGWPWRLRWCVQTMVQQFELLFECAVRQSIVQEVPLVNTSDQYMQVSEFVQTNHPFLDSSLYTKAASTMVLPTESTAARS